VVSFEVLFEVLLVDTKFAPEKLVPDKFIYESNVTPEKLNNYYT